MCDDPEALFRTPRTRPLDVVYDDAAQSPKSTLHCIRAFLEAGGSGAVGEVQVRVKGGAAGATMAQPLLLFHKCAKVVVNGVEIGMCCQLKSYLPRLWMLILSLVLPSQSKLADRAQHDANPALDKSPPRSGSILGELQHSQCLMPGFTTITLQSGLPLVREEQSRKMEMESFTSVRALGVRRSPLNQELHSTESSVS